MSYLIKPANYKPLLDLKQTELGIKQIKEFFQQNLSSELRLRRVTAPLFVLKGMGINDDLSGTERPVSFPIKDLGDAQAEVVHSLAKWKRLTLAEYNIEPGYGIYTDMNAIRRDEELDNIHKQFKNRSDKPISPSGENGKAKPARAENPQQQIAGPFLVAPQLRFKLGDLLLVCHVVLSFRSSAAGRGQWCSCAMLWSWRSTAPCSRPVPLSAF